MDSSTFESQLNYTFYTFSNMLRSGYSVLQSIERLAGETPDPIGGEFQKVLDEHSAGTPLMDALDNMNNRVQSERFDEVLDIMKQQRKEGGNLADKIEEGFLGIAAGTQTFDDQLDYAIQLMANMLRSGYSVLQCFERLSGETPSPIRNEFEQVVEAISNGTSWHDSIASMQHRVKSSRFDKVVSIMANQRETGGNLAMMLEDGFLS